MHTETENLQMKIFLSLSLNWRKCCLASCKLAYDTPHLFPPPPAHNKAEKEEEGEGRIRESE